MPEHESWKLKPSLSSKTWNGLEYNILSSKKPRLLFKTTVVSLKVSSSLSFWMSKINLQKRIWFQLFQLIDEMIICFFHWHWERFGLSLSLSLSLSLFRSFSTISPFSSVRGMIAQFPFEKIMIIAFLWQKSYRQTSDREWHPLPIENKKEKNSFSQFALNKEIELFLEHNELCNHMMVMALACNGAGRGSIPMSSFRL